MLNNDYFEQIHRIQKMMDSMNFKQIQQQLEMINTSSLIQPLEMAQTVLSPATKAFLESQSLMQKVISPSMTEFIGSLDFLRESPALSKAMQSQFEQLRPVMEKLSQYATLQIPDSLYPRLEELTAAVNDVLPKEEHNDLPSSITVVRPDEKATAQPWTWGKLQTHLSLVINLIAMFYIAQQSTIQLDMLHKEQMVEMRTQTELLEKHIESTDRQTELLEEQIKLEQQQVEIERERLEIEKKRLEIEKVRSDRERNLEEKFTSFLEHMKPLVPEDQNGPKGEE